MVLRRSLGEYILLGPMGSGLQIAQLFIILLVELYFATPGTVTLKITFIRQFAIASGVRNDYLPRVGLSDPIKQGGSPP